MTVQACILTRYTANKVWPGRAPLVPVASVTRSNFPVLLATLLSHGHGMSCHVLIHELASPLTFLGTCLPLRAPSFLNTRALSALLSCNALRQD